MTCTCIELTDKALEEQFNARLNITFSLTDGWVRIAIGTYLIEKKRGKKPPTIVAIYCPFCGVKYETETDTKETTNV